MKVRSGLCIGSGAVAANELQAGHGPDAKRPASPAADTESERAVDPANTMGESRGRPEATRRKRLPP